MVHLGLFDVLRINKDIMMLDIFLVDQVVLNSGDFIFCFCTPRLVDVADEHVLGDVVLLPWLWLLRVNDVLHDVVRDVLFNVPRVR